MIFQVNQPFICFRGVVLGSISGTGKGLGTQVNHHKDLEVKIQSRRCEMLAFLTGLQAAEDIYILLIVQIRPTS